MTLKQRLARQRKRRDQAAHNMNSRTAKLKTITVKLTRRPKLAFYLIDKHPGLRFTSGWRSVAHNAAVGGVPGSWHTKGTRTHPGAIDMVGTLTDMRAGQATAARVAGPLAESLIHDVGSGLHLHVAGNNVIAFDWPESMPRGKKLRERIRKARSTRLDAQKRIAALRKKIAAAAKPVKATGIDVSSHQGVVDFKKVKEAGVDFVWIKSSEGETFVDPGFHRNVRTAKAAGLKVGAYHFLRPRGDRSGAAEAKVFARLLKDAGLGKGDLIPIMDVEVADGRSPGQIVSYTNQFAQEMGRLGHKRVGLYTFPFFLNDWGVSLGRRPLWIADFRGLSKPSLPRPFRSYVAWQHTDKGSVPGVSGHVDKNKTSDLRKLIA